MTTTASPRVKDSDSNSFGLVESASVNSIADFVASDLFISQENGINQEEDFINLFICHLIFYAFFCVSIVLYLFIDLGLGNFIKNKFIHILQDGYKTVFHKTAAFA
tara:strand:+ start:219 stop:536 length:318 start_codon:yes stop_codon:yes gene_type:complete